MTQSHQRLQTGDENNVAVDLRAERVFTTRRSAVTLFVEVDNVYNRNNVYMYEWSKALRGVQPILQWGLTPIGGVRIDF